MTSAPQETPNPEAQRIALVGRLNEVMGKTDFPLSEVLSYFPHKAELFIRTQKYAQQIEGKREGMSYYYVNHKQNSAGLNGNMVYQPGSTEHLGIEGFTGEQLINLIGEVRNLRGEGWQGELRYYSPSEETLDRILQAAEKPIEEFGLMDKKALEVMKVTPDELELMRGYRDARRQSDALMTQAENLKAKAENLTKQAESRMARARQKVEQKYPRRPKS